MTADGPDDIVTRDLPRLYRFILKIPKLGLEGLPERFQGIFWVLILPLLVFSDFFANLLLLTVLPVPYNLVSLFAVTSVAILLILRILLERSLNSKRALLEEGHFRWNVDQACQDYVQLLQKKQKRRANRKDA